MVTLKSDCEPPGGLCALNAWSSSSPSAPTIPQEQKNTGLIITGSFNGLLDRLANIDYFDVWLKAKKILKKAKKEGIEAAIRMSEVCNLTGLSAEDIELFVSFSLIEVVEAGEDPLLPFRDFFCLVKIFDRSFDEGVIP